MTELFGEGSGATMSECGKYRYRLWRDWDRTREHVLWVMLNPSTAHATKDDHTIRKCVGFTKRWGYGRIEVVNLFAFRATDPRELLAVEDPVGPRNSWELEEAFCNEPALIVAAWGQHGARHSQSTNIWSRLVILGAMCLGMTKSWQLPPQPLHPLRVPYSTKLVRLPRVDEY